MRLKKVSTKILIVEDEIDIREGISEYLSEVGYDVMVAEDGQEGIDLFKSNEFDLVLLDIMLPKINGFGVLSQIREISDVPVMMLTAMTDDYSQIMSFNEKADDYITKPFSVVVLHKRIEALQRRIQGRQQNNKWIYKDVEVDFLGFCAKKDNNPVDLKPKEIKLLELLIKHKNQVLTRNQMLDSLWEIDEAPADRVIDVYIKNLRKKLDLDCITTVKGIGYKFEDK
ncbi:response regulator transcription factor [Intestinibacter bartlettii]|jgi:two-component system response regulator VanR|nr:response regulator transcription factor [Clostridium sp. 1001270J_160509_D11]MBS7148193.1 response regulator transcription factor [Intestinibacter bartlettii]MCB5402957.1 response regulator transcription factor [Intestinibacter bartlettii]MCB5745555.1 response regulator transcription factor [Intestinibacter bartlettii]MCB5748018.1 response regulator transcription factor [Intestinibacter bartlettii]MCC2706092.1 response regulator transcription factor [Intestinibacter bartlettii]